MAGYIIDIWKDDELVQSIAGKWTEDEARRLTMYYLGFYRAERAQLLRERSPSGRRAQDEPSGRSTRATTRRRMSRLDEEFASPAKKQWGRSGSPGTVRLTSFDRYDEAAKAERQIIKRRLSHGYTDRAA